jgi:hypothetical protein
METPAEPPGAADHCCSSVRGGTGIQDRVLRYQMLGSRVAGRKNSLGRKKN